MFSWNFRWVWMMEIQIFSTWIWVKVCINKCLNWALNRWTNCPLSKWHNKGDGSKLDIARVKSKISFMNVISNIGINSISFWCCCSLLKFFMFTFTFHKLHVSLVLEQFHFGFNFILWLLNLAIVNAKLVWVSCSILFLANNGTLNPPSSNVPIWSHVRLISLAISSSFVWFCFKFLPKIFECVKIQWLVLQFHL